MDMHACLAAVASADTGQRNAAELALKQLLEQNPAMYFLELSKELRADGVEDRLRQQAGLLMKVSLDATVRAAASRLTTAVGSASALHRLRLGFRAAL